MPTTIRVTELTRPDDGGAAATQALEKEVIGIFVELAGMLGLPRSVGEIYGLLYASPQPLSFTDIQERLRISKGSVSQGLRALRGVGALKVIAAEDVIRQALGPAAGTAALAGPLARAGGRRSDFYVPETELRTLMAGFLRESIEPQLKRGLARIGRMKERHAGLLAGGNGGVVVLHERVEKLETWHRKGGTLLPMIAKFLG